MRQSELKSIRHMQVVDLTGRPVRNDVADMRAIFLFEIDLDPPTRQFHTSQDQECFKGKER